ncbi:MAG: hypothetical protein JSV79_00230 [Armatimonadota bacterium]|nr:MAG: hypothetical protein JSV79_00230 [Armatimonadota bacterium]
MPGRPATRIGDLISVSPAPAVISLSDVARLMDDIAAGADASEALSALVAGYSLENPETQAAFDAMVRSLGREERRGDAFIIQGVYGTGKSHLLAVLTLLCAHPEQVWPAFLEAHADFHGPEFRSPRLVVAIPLDEYPSGTHSLEYIVLSRIEAELAACHGVQVALTEDSHLLDLVDRYVAAQAGEDLDRSARETHGLQWEELRARDHTGAAQVALAFIKESKFPLDWHRSRAEAWGALRRALQMHGIDGPVLLLDELGTFLAGKDRRALNADASFLQYLAQRPTGDRCWLICVTQRGLDEVGDVDRRTLRQLRDRFRPGFTLDLSELGWVVEHRLVRKGDPEAFRKTMGRVHAEYCAAAGTPPFSAAELAQSYPLNPLCLQAIQRAAETCLSRTRSAVRLLQEMLLEQRWLELPADRLMTPDAAFDLFRGEMALSASGQRHLHAYDVVTANAGRIAPGREAQVGLLMKALCLLGLGELRWSEKQLRGSLVGCSQPELWQQPELLRELLQALHRRGAYVERARGEAEEGDEYYVDVSSDASERIRRRLTELTAELTPDDSRVARAALEACRDSAFPLAALAEPRTIGVIWLHGRRYVSAVCRDPSTITRAEVQNLAGELEASHVREDGRLFFALPIPDRPQQEEAWRTIGADIKGQFAAGIVAWLPRELSDTQREHLVEHAALASMVVDRTLARRRDREFRDRLRERWAESEAEVKQMLQRAYYEGSVIGPGGEDVIEPERLSTLFGDWEETLTAIFSKPFRQLFPRFESIAPERRLVGRAQTNQIIDQFIRPGHAELPPASTLEAHLIAYAAPLGMVGGEERHPRLALKRRDLVEAAVAAAPSRSGREELDPHETMSYGELAGRLAKSEWGLTHEQSELLIAALIRTGHLAALDAFLQPVRLDVVAAPLGDNLPYVMRGEALRGAVSEQARALWEAALGESDVAWDLPTQERAWGEMIAWAERLSEGAEENRAAIVRAAESLGHQKGDWVWAQQALGRAEALAGSVDGSLTSADGLTKLASAGKEMPGGLEETAELVAGWRECDFFLKHHLGKLAHLYALLDDDTIQVPPTSLLGHERRSVLDWFASPERMVAEQASVEAAARRWLEHYRRHYLAWHSRGHSAARFEELAKLRRSPALEATGRLARAGLRTEDAAVIEAELGRALGQRCLAGDPLPEGRVVCPICGLRLGREIELPDSQELAKRVGETLTRQQNELRGQSEVLRRRLGGCSDERVKEAVEDLLAGPKRGSPETLNALLTDAVIAWLRQQIGRPRARRRELRRLEELLRGKELTKREVMQIVEEWLEGGGDDYIAIV